MAELCDCEGGLSSLHRKRDCKSFLKKAVHILPMQRKGTVGKNFIDLTTIPVPESIFKGLFNAVNPKDRLHVIYDIKNTAFDPQEGATEDWQDGTSSKLRDGHLQMTFIIPETDLNFIGNSMDLECRNPDLYLYLADGSIVGYADRDTIGADKKLYPLPVDRWDVLETPITTDEGVAKVAVTIYFSNEMSYKKWVVMSPTEHMFDETENYEPMEAKLALGATATTATAMEVTATMAGFGILGNSIGLTGLGVTDLALTSNGAPVTILTVVESPVNTYTLTFASQTSGDQLIATLAPVSNYVSNAVTDLVP